MFANNTLVHNLGHGLQVSGQIGGLSVQQNNLFGNQDYDIYLSPTSPGQILNATNNYWGTTPIGEIEGRIFDCNDNALISCGGSGAFLGEVLYGSPLVTPAQNAPAFITASTFDPQPVGLNQKGTLTLDFSRPMDTTKLPDLTFFDSRRGTVEELPGTTFGTSLARDPNGAIWFGCTNSTPDFTSWGLKRFDGQTWTNYTTSNGLGSNQISNLFITHGGDVWVSHSDSSNARLSWFSGGQWKVFSMTDVPGGPAVNYVSAIGEDKTGKVWFAMMNSVASFDGVNWTVFTSAEVPLLSNQISGITTDGQGRLWFAHSAAISSGLSSFDGTTWKTFTPGAGLPANTAYVGSLFSDSHGRVWFTIYVSQANTNLLGMIDGDTWTYFKTGDAGYPFNTTVLGFADHPDGSLWIVGNNMGTYNTAIFDGKRFTTHSSPAAIPFIFDPKGSMFMGGTGSTPARVLWAGETFAFDSGAWLSSTRYQSSYNFTGLVPPGTYKVASAGALGTDGVEAYSGSIINFNVDYAGQVSETTPPNSPIVKALGKKGDPTGLKATWTVVDPKNQVDSYRYAIGTSKGATNILYWTTLSQPLIDRSGLPLTEGQTYWVTVQAHNLIGLWGTSGYDSFVAGKPDEKVYIPAIRR